MKVPLILVLLSAFLTFSCTLPAIKQQTPQTPQQVAQSGPVIDYFYSSPACSNCGDNITLQWHVTGADNISLDQGIGAVAPAENLTVSPTVTTTYTLTARSGTRTTTDSSTVVVAPATIPAVSQPAAAPPPAPAPSVDYFDTTPNIIAPGDIITLVWKTTGANTVSIDNVVGSVTTSGRYSLILYTTTAFTLTAVNSAGQVTAQVVANVEEPGVGAVFLPVQAAPYTDIQAVVGHQFTINQDWTNWNNNTWTVDYYDPTSVQVISQSYQPYNPPYRGVNGQEIFVFQALKAGDTKLLLSYYDVNAPIDSHSLYYMVHILPP